MLKDILTTVVTEVEGYKSPVYCTSILLFLHLQVKVLQKQLESETEKKTSLASDLQAQLSELSLMRTREKLLVRDLEEAKEARSSLEKELHKLEAQKSVDDVQMKELNDTLEAEQYFSVSYFLFDFSSSRKIISSFLLY